MVFSSLRDQQKSEFSVHTNLKELAKRRGWAFEVTSPPSVQIHYPSNAIEEDLLYVLEHWGQLLNLPPAERIKFGREEHFYHLHCAVSEEISETFRCKIPCATVLNPTGLVITSDFEILSQSLDRQKIDVSLNIGQIKENFDHHRILPGTYVSLLSYWSYTFNFAHWLMDCLPKIALLESLSSDLKFIIPNKSPDYLIDSLKLLGIQESQMLTIEKESVIVEELILCYAAQKSGRPCRTHLLEIRNKLLDASVTGNQYAHSHSKRVYVSRSRSSRRVVNENEILKTLENYNFETIRCEAMSFLEQIRTFSKAEAVLGSHGAGIYNQIFCNSGAIIIEIYNKEYWHHSSRIISSFMGHAHWHTFGESVSEDGQTWVDPLKLDKVLSLALRDKPV